jgi:hypothetical protein
MSKLIKFILLFFISVICCSASFAHNETTVLSGEVTMIPRTFYGTWRVVSSKIDSDSNIFKEKSLDIWNLSRTGNVISLCNPFNGAKAEITIERVEANDIVFTKIGNYGKKILTDKVELSIDNDSFTGTNTIKLDTYSDGKLIKTETATYKIRGEKIAGGVEIE